MSLRRVAMSFFRVFVPGVVIPFVVVLCRSPMGLGSPFMMLGSLVVFVLRHNQLQFGLYVLIIPYRPAGSTSGDGHLQISAKGRNQKVKRPHFQSGRTLRSRCCISMRLSKR